MTESETQQAATEIERKPWLFSEHELENTPSRQDKMTRELERTKRKSVCKLIAELGQLIKPPASLCAINSGKVFFHRVFMVQSMAEGRQNPKVSKHPLHLANLTLRNRLLELLASSWHARVKSVSVL